MRLTLPESDGYLPYFLLYGCIAAWIHSAVCYLSPPSTALKIFSGPGASQPDQLLAHVYGVKNIYTGAIRLYAAYNLENPILYDLAILSYIGVLVLFVPEYFVWKTAGTREVLFPFVTASTGVLWMGLQRYWYVTS